MPGEIVLVDQIEPMIKTVRGQNVVLDSDLANLYGVPVKRLNEQVRRNRGRFPDDFMFQLTAEEAPALRSQGATLKSGQGNSTGNPDDLRSQIATSRSTHGGRRYSPLVFTEHGAIMAANVLNSPRAVEVGVYVVRAFVKLRQYMANHTELARKLTPSLNLWRRRWTENDQARSVSARTNNSGTTARLIRN